MAPTTFAILFLIGATLSVRFNVVILFPAIGLAVLGTVVGIAHGDSVGAVMLTIASEAAAALQIGYLSGVVTCAVIASFGVPERKPGMVEKLGHR